MALIIRTARMHAGKLGDLSERYSVGPSGEIGRPDLVPPLVPSGKWLLTGFVNRYGRLTVPLADFMADPSRALGLGVRDLDHGTTRLWGGQVVAEIEHDGRIIADLYRVRAKRRQASRDRHNAKRRAKRAAAKGAV